MQLYLIRLIMTCVISATLVAQARLSHAQQEVSSPVIAVLDVQKVLDSMPNFQKELKALEELDDSIVVARPRGRCRQISPQERKLTALSNEFSRVKKAVAEVAISKNVALVLRAPTADFSIGDSRKLEHVDKANKNLVVFQNRIDMTQAVIERLQQADKSPSAIESK